MSVFPLPLNAVEHYMLADDSADYPRIFSLVLRLRIRVDESRLRSAIDTATLRHPLLRAKLEYHDDTPKSWIAGERSTFSIVTCAKPVARLRSRQQVVQPIDLRYEPGVRFVILRGADVDSLVIDFHHATADGLGAMQFVGDLLALYELGESSIITLPYLQLQSLATRDAFGLSGWRRPIRWLYGTFGWLGIAEYVLQLPVPLGNAEANKFGDRQSGYCSITFSGGDTQALLAATNEEGATLNDRLIRDVFIAMQEHMERHFPERARSLQRIMVPTNLRSADDDQLSAANVVAMVNIDRRPHRWPDRRQMLRVLHRELAIVKRLRLGVIFVQVVGTLQWMFGSLQRFLPADRCQATCVVSNLGVVLANHSSHLVERIEFYPPIRPLTSAAFGAATFDGRLTLSLHYDAAAIEADQAAELLDRVVELLKSS